MAKLLLGLCVAAGAFFLMSFVPETLMTAQNLKVVLCILCGVGAMGLARK